MTGSRWMRDASCNGLDPDLWFPLSPLSRAGRLAIEICADCPVRAECLEYAVQRKVHYGIWGGQWMQDRSVAGSDQEELREAVRTARDSGWNQAQVARHLRIPTQTVRRYFRELGAADLHRSLMEEESWNTTR